MEYQVQQGDSLYSIARAFGIPCEKIWNHPDNHSLRRQDRVPGILHPGDVLNIPDKEGKYISRPTDQRHAFRCRTETVRIELRFLECGEPRANQPYRLQIDSSHGPDGILDENGCFRATIRADARRLDLWIGPSASETHYPVLIGYINPITEESGVRQRLQNLGFLQVDSGTATPADVVAALAGFQSMEELPITGILDEGTRQKLVEVHGS